MIIANNTANTERRTVLNKRYYDMINNAQNEPQRTPEDIVSGIKNSLELIRKEDEQNVGV